MLELYPGHGKMFMFFLPLTPVCDLDLCGMNMVLNRDKLSCKGENLR